MNGGWILCSERLPELTNEWNIPSDGEIRHYSDLVIVTTTEGDVVLARYICDEITDPEIFQEVVGDLAEDQLKVWIAEGPQDYWEDAVDVIAWMPLPEPWKGAEA